MSVFTEDRLAMLRRNGVQKFSDSDGSVEFFAPTPDMKSEPVEKVDAKCECGHEQHEHGGGLCLLGCDPTKCAPPEA